ncbi:MAG: beta-ketoacyl-[acyl-carrier-protein] synthase family protein [Polyangia bacterium]
MRIAVTGLGAVTGFGRGVDVLWRGLVDGRRATAIRPELGSLAHVGPVALVPELVWGEATAARAETISRWAAEEALADAGVEGASTSLCYGTTKGGIAPFLELVRDAAHLPFDPPARATYAGPALALATALGVRHVEVASAACVSSNVALGTALDLLRSGEATCVLAGGGDALSDFVISGFASLKALDPAPSRPFDGARRGLNLGEGAAFLVLEREDTARARGARVRAWLEGYGLSADAVHMTGPDRQGRGAARAMTAALAEAHLRPEQIDFISAHGTGTVFNDLMEDKAIALTFGARAIPLHSIKGAIGHTLGGSAALEAIVTVLALETGLVPPTAGYEHRDAEISLDVVAGAPRPLALQHAISTSSGFGGTNAAIVLSRAT